MSGTIILEGGAEFGGAMAAVDKHALALAGGPAAAVVIIPTAAAPDNNHRRAGNNGINWFRRLGATNVTAVDLIDAHSAANPPIVDAIRDSKLIFILGGFPGYLAQTLIGSPAEKALRDAYNDGAVIAGSSAGAMVLCEHFYDPSSNQLHPGLNFIANCCVLPHHNTFGRRWAPQLQKKLPDSVLIGIDEYTGIVGKSAQDEWALLGGGGVTLYRSQQRPQEYTAGKTLHLFYE